MRNVQRTLKQGHRLVENFDCLIQVIVVISICKSLRCLQGNERSLVDVPCLRIYYCCIGQHPRLQFLNASVREVPCHGPMHLRPLCHCEPKHMTDAYVLATCQPLSSDTHTYVLQLFSSSQAGTCHVYQFHHFCLNCSYYAGTCPHTADAS